MLNLSNISNEVIKETKNDNFFGVNDRWILSIIRNANLLRSKIVSHALENSKQV